MEEVEQDADGRLIERVMAPCLMAAENGGLGVIDRLRPCRHDQFL